MRQPAEERRATTPRDAVLIGVLLLLALALRFAALGAEGLWVDEAYTTSLVQRPVGEILARLRADEAPPLFYFLEKGSLALVGRSEAGARFFPALAGFATVLAGWWALQRVRDASATTALAVFATSVLLVYYARQARSYSLAHIEATLYLIATVEMIRHPDRGRAITFAVLGLALLYTHNLGFWVCGAGVLAVAPALLHRDERRTVVVGGLLGLAAGALPWVAALIGQIGVHRELNVWMGQYWEGRPFALAPLYSLGVFTNGASAAFQPQVVLPTLPGGWDFLSWILWALVLGGVVRTFWEARPERPGLGARAARASVADFPRVALCFVIVPLVGPVITAPLTGPTYVLGRTDTLALPGFLLVIAIGWRRMPWRWFAPAASGLWILSGVLSLVAFSWGPRAKGSDRDLAAILGREIGARDALVVGALGRPTLEYYAERQGWLDRVASFRGFPAVTDQNPAALYPLSLDSLSSWYAEARDQRARWERDGIERVWIFAIRATDDEESSSWPQRPTPPPAERAFLRANMVAYPLNLLVFALVGLEPVPVIREYRQDWVAGDRVVLRADRSSWIPSDRLPGELRQ